MVLERTALGSNLLATASAGAEGIITVILRRPVLLDLYRLDNVSALLNEIGEVHAAKGTNEPRFAGGIYPMHGRRHADRGPTLKKHAFREHSRRRLVVRDLNM